MPTNSTPLENSHEELGVSVSNWLLATSAMTISSAICPLGNDQVGGPTDGFANTTPLVRITA